MKRKQGISNQKGRFLLLMEMEGSLDCMELMGIKVRRESMSRLNL